MIPTGHYALSIQNCVSRNQLALKTWCPGIHKHPLGAQAWLVCVVLNVPNSCPEALIRCLASGA